jgi:hypothetical protein
MKHLRWIFCVMLVAALALLGGRSGHASFVQTQRDQIAVFILVNVTPAPVGYAPQPSGLPAPDSRIALRMQLHAKGSGRFDNVPGFRLTDGMVAQATTQSAVRVQAQVTPNPMGTLLFSNSPAVVLNQTAGTSASTTCAYTVTVDTTQTSWTLYEGLSNDFSGTIFPGKDLENNTYIQGGSPNPAPTAFIVYPDNNKQWSIFSKSSLSHTYCVDLKLTIPGSVAGGAYSTNAIYTLYY